MCIRDRPQACSQQQPPRGRPEFSSMIVSHIASLFDAPDRQDDGCAEIVGNPGSPANCSLVQARPSLHGARVTCQDRAWWRVGWVEPEGCCLRPKAAQGSTTPGARGFAAARARATCETRACGCLRPASCAPRNVAAWPQHTQMESQACLLYTSRCV